MRGGAFDRGRRRLIAAGLALALAGAAVPAGAAPEMKKVTLGLTLATATFLPIYLAEERGYFKAEGFAVDIVGFRGGSDLTRALVARSVDVGVASPAGVIAAIQAGQDMKVFFGGFNQVPFEWYARPPVKTAADLKGKVIGITRFGSSTDVLTRMVLARAGLDPARDVRIVQGGGSPERLAAMEAGQIDGGPFASPHNFMAADRGYALIARQSDFMPDYPVQSFFAMTRTIDANPETMKAILRAFVKGVRDTKADRAAAVKILVSKIGLEAPYAERVYDEMLDGFREDGRLGSEAGLKAFMEMGVAAGEFEKPMPLEAYFTDRFTSTRAAWAP